MEQQQIFLDQNTGISYAIVEHEQQVGPSLRQEDDNFHNSTITGEICILIGSRYRFIKHLIFLLPWHMLCLNASNRILRSSDPMKTRKYVILMFSKIFLI